MDLFYLILSTAQEQTELSLLHQSLYAFCRFPGFLISFFGLFWFICIKSALWEAVLETGSHIQHASNYLSRLKQRIMGGFVVAS